jgi:hypothetical protein
MRRRETEEERRRFKTRKELEEWIYEEKRDKGNVVESFFEFFLCFPSFCAHLILLLYFLTT